MGVSTSCNVAFFTKDKKLVSKNPLDSRADDFIYGLVNDGGATFEPEKYGDFSHEEIEIMQIFFDENSMSVSENHAQVRPNIQDPAKLQPIWIKIRSHIIKTFNKSIKDYRDSLLLSHSKMVEKIEKSNNTQSGLFSKKKAIQISNPSIKMEDYAFDRLLFDYTWSLNCISKVMAALEIAVINNYLVEVTVSDW